MGTTPHDVRMLLGPFAFPLPVETHPCGYLENLAATDEAYAVLQLAPLAYHGLMNRNFRRAGQVLYRPRCHGCDRCRQIRVPAAEFTPSRSQRRCWKKNQDLVRQVCEPHLTREKHELYARYLSARHPGSPQSTDIGAMRSFLFTSCVNTVEVDFRDPAGKLVGVAMLDVCSESISSVYHFFAPEEEKRGLGVFLVLAALEMCRARGIPWYYLGYVVQGCEAMEYKTLYRPHEILQGDRWVRVRE